MKTSLGALLIVHGILGVVLGIAFAGLAYLLPVQEYEIPNSFHYGSPSLFCFYVPSPRLLALVVPSLGSGFVLVSVGLYLFLRSRIVRGKSEIRTATI